MRGGKGRGVEVCTDKNVCDFLLMRSNLRLGLLRRCTRGSCLRLGLFAAVRRLRLWSLRKPEKRLRLGSCVDREQSTTGHVMTLQPRTAYGGARDWVFLTLGKALFSERFTVTTYARQSGSSEPLWARQSRESPGVH